MPDLTVAAQLPGEGVAIALIGLLDKLIDGQTPEQKAKLWDNWINFWQPVINLMVKK